MILTPKDYAVKFPKCGKILCSETIKNRCRHNQLPSNHIPHKLTGGWVIEIKELPEEWKGFEVMLKPKR